MFALSDENRTHVKAAESRWLPKFILRLITLLLAFVSLGVGIAIWVKDLPTIWLLVPLLCSITWNLANVIVRMTRARPMHPGANVACDLLLWLGFAVAVAIGIIFDVFTYWDSSYYSYGNGYGDDGDTCDAGDSDCSHIVNEVSRLSTLGFVTFGISGAITVLHFILFCWACADESKRRGSEVDNRAAAIAAAMVQEMQMQRTGQLAQQSTNTPYKSGHFQLYSGPTPHGGFAPYPMQAQWIPPHQGDQQVNSQEARAQINPLQGPQLQVQEHSGGRQVLQAMPEAQERAGSEREPVPHVQSSDHHGFYAPEAPTVYTGATSNGKGKDREMYDEGHASSSSAGPSSNALATNHSEPGTAQ